MIDPAFVQTFAAYNRWQNDNLLAAADRLSDAERRADRGVFFGSIQATLNHLLWADRMWMSRFSDIAPPITAHPGLDDVADWSAYRAARRALDQTIIDWAGRLAPADLAGELIWTARQTKSEVATPRWLAITHMFNHQTHHRGQVHGVLTGFGAAPDATDLVMMPTLASARG